MTPKVRIEIDESAEEQIIIRAKKLSEDVIALQRLIESASGASIDLKLDGREYIIKTADILFFETVCEKTAAQTAENMFYTELTLSELEERLPRYFMRVSKSCIINTFKIYSLSRSLTGVCEAEFEGCGKKAYISRMYYRAFREKLEEMRLRK